MRLIFPDIHDFWVCEKWFRSLSKPTWLKKSLNFDMNIQYVCCLKTLQYCIICIIMWLRESIFISLILVYCIFGCLLPDSKQTQKWRITNIHLIQKSCNCYSNFFRENFKFYLLFGHRPPFRRRPYFFWDSFSPFFFSRFIVSFIVLITLMMKITALTLYHSFTFLFYPSPLSLLFPSPCPLLSSLPLKILLACHLVGS